MDLNRICYILMASLLDRYDSKNWLRSWVQIPPGPLLFVLEIRHYFEVDFGYCRTDSAAMPMPYPAVSLLLNRFLQEKVVLQLRCGLFFLHILSSLHYLV
jgi:hypothetical protein